MQKYLLAASLFALAGFSGSSQTASASSPVRIQNLRLLAEERVDAKSFANLTEHIELSCMVTTSKFLFGSSLIDNANAGQIPAPQGL